MGTKREFRKLRRKTPVDEAAKYAIGKHFVKLLECYDSIGKADSRDIEIVHQLRVSSRRVAVAIKLFAPCIPKGERRRLVRAVKCIRDVAGKARDWDVFLECLRVWSQTCGSRAVPGADFLIAFSLGNRMAAQQELDLLVESLNRASLKELWSAAEDAMRIPEEWADLTLAEHAQAEISVRLEACSEAFEEDDPSPQKLHQARIKAKRLRYALELLGDCLDHRGVAQLRKDVEKVQEILGAVHDSHVATERVERLSAVLELSDPQIWTRVSAGLMSFAAYQEKVGLEQTERYLREIVQWLKARPIA